MIETSAITHWRHHAPWQSDAQIEQDLVLSRALVDIFSDPFLNRSLAFRGGTALNKLYLPHSTRYSEDLDFVQIKPQPIGETIDHIRDVLDPWLGEPRRKRNEGRVVLYYRFDSEGLPSTPLRLKVEINTREHFSFLGYIHKELNVENSWFTGRAEITCFRLEELLATKLRALYQRKKGRDLYDLYICHEVIKSLDFGQVYECFTKYMDKQGLSVTRGQFEENLFNKLSSKFFVNDIAPLMKSNTSSFFNVEKARVFLERQLLPLFPGEPWNKPDK